jgi:hypothetical protein
MRDQRAARRRTPSPKTGIQKDALMRQIRIGDITIDAVIEREGPWRRGASAKPPNAVIPGCAAWRGPGIHNHHREYGFRARSASLRAPE